MNRFWTNVFIKIPKKFYLELNSHLSTTAIKNETTAKIRPVREITVPQFSNININLPFDIKIKPLDVHQYPEGNKVKINITSNVGEEKLEDEIRHSIEGLDVSISYNGDKNKIKGVQCEIEAPLKSNLDVKSPGDITSLAFSGPKLILQSSEGSIFVDEKYEGELIDLQTHSGDIVLKKSVVAAEIRAKVSQSGSITTDKLQGLQANLWTCNGHIKVNSSYCNYAMFETKNGDMFLNNIHKLVRIRQQNGFFNLSGLDGQLDAVLTNCKGADVQLSRVLGESSLDVQKGGNLNLKLSEACQSDTMFEIRSKDQVVDDNIRLITSKNQLGLFLTPTCDNFKVFRVSCDDCVHVQSAAWADMFQLRFKEGKSNK